MNPTFIQASETKGSSNTMNEDRQENSCPKRAKNFSFGQAELDAKTAEVQAQQQEPEAPLENEDRTREKTAETQLALHDSLQRAETKQADEHWAETAKEKLVAEVFAALTDAVPSRVEQGDCTVAPNCRAGEQCLLGVQGA